MPNPDTSHVTERLWECLEDLVCGTPAATRLYDVCLKITGLHENDIPEEILEDFQLVKDRLQSVGLNQLDQIATEEASEIGRKILSMYTKIRGGIS